MSKAKVSSVSSEEEQQLLLEEAKKRVDVEAFYMKRCLDNGKLMDALKHSANMVGQLRTSLLSPKNYYVLYISAFDHLRYLENYLLEEKNRGEKISKLYELVQYAGNILPRLYLLVTVGSVYIRSHEAPSKDILRDLVEMCKGVQHPTRGLFLRNYLSEVTKDKLPDSDSEEGSVMDSIEFILQNFTEMNKLWVRMQHQGAPSEKEKREQEREELRLLVGKNLARLSQLEGVDIDIYTSSVLPNIMEQIVNCKDRIAQQYLMECVIQVFPDEYHLKTLGEILKTCGLLCAEVDTRQIIVSLIDRLAAFAQRQPSSNLTDELNVFEVFYQHFGNLNDQYPNMLPEHVLQLQASLLNLSMCCYPDNLEYVDRVLKLSTATLTKFRESAPTTLHKPQVTKQITTILTMPLDTYKNILTVLRLENYSSVMSFLNYAARKRVSTDIAKNAVENETRLSTTEHVERLFEFISPLVRDEPDGPSADTIDEEDIEEDQSLVAGLVHLFSNAELEQLFAMYLTARRAFVKEGPTTAMRLKYTIPPLIFCAFRLAETVRGLGDEAANTAAKRVFKFVFENLKSLTAANYPALTLRLFLQAVGSAGRCGFEEIAYEFFAQAFAIYEESIPETKAQIQALQLICGTLQSTHFFEKENYDRLVAKTAGQSGKLLQKHDQARAVFNCSHLFWKEGTAESDYRDEKLVLDCLQKSRRIAKSCLEPADTARLLVEILNKLLYYYLQNNNEVSEEVVNELITEVNGALESLEQTAETASIQNLYQSTLRYIEYRKQTSAKEGHRSFAGIHA